MASVQRALTEGVPHDVEYRIVAPDGTVRWCEGKGRVEYRDGRPVAMSGVCMMVTRRKEAELAKLAAAEESSRLKDEFLATLSHELRTPLNAILGWVQMLQGGELSSARAQQAIDVIGRNARLQAQLIEDILDVSRIISGKLEIERAPVAMAQLLDTVVAGALPAADAKRITLERRIADELPPIEGDPKRLHQVFSNVLVERREVHAGRRRHRPGLPPAARRGWRSWFAIQASGSRRTFCPYVFDRFRQADSRPTRSHGGLGLGLAIARHLVEQHGGEIEARSDGLGMGRRSSRFDCRCRRQGRQHLSAGRRQPIENVRLDNLKIAVVDDEPDSREMLATLLEQRGARVRQCADAESVLREIACRPG